MATYTKQTWTDDNPSYPVSAARFMHMEEGIYAAAPSESPTFTGTVTLPVSTIVASYLAPESVETSKIKLLNVTAGTLAAEAVEESKIKKEAVSAVKTLVGVPGAYEARSANESLEASATETTTVYLSIKGKAEATAYEVISDGKAVYKVAEETLVAADVAFTHIFRIKAKGKWEVKVTKGTLAEIHSVYQAG